MPGLIAQLKNSIPPQKKADIMLSIGFGYLFKPGEAKADMDSALFYAENAMAISKEAAIINESRLLTAMVFLEKGELVSAKRMLPMVSDTTRIKLLFCISKHYLYNENKGNGDYAYMDTTFRYAQTAIKLASSIKHPTLFPEALIWLDQLAMHNFQTNRYAIAEKQFLFLLEHCNNVVFPSRTFIMTRLSSLYLGQGDFYKALSYALEAEKLITRNTNITELCFIYTNLISHYQITNKHEKAMIYLEKLLEDPEKFSACVYIPSLITSYCNALRSLNRNDEALVFIKKFEQRFPAKTDIDKSNYHLNLAYSYTGMNNFKLAEESLLAAIKYAELAKQSTAVLHSILGSLYIRFHYPEKANIPLKIAEKGLAPKQDAHMKPIILDNLARSEASLGNYESAYKYIMQRNTITDSVYNVSKEKHTQELEFQYQTQKKEADIRLKEENIRYLNQNAELMARDAKLQKAKLNEASLLAGQKEASLLLKEKNIENLTNRAKLQQTEIDQAASKRKITALVIILLAVIIALFVWLFWSKLRSNKIITDKNGLLQQLVTEKSWLVKEMHHRVKNNLHTVMSLLESQSAYLQDDALDAVKNSQCRIFSMSLIHQKLYQEDVVKTIDMECYIPELISYLRECFNLPGSFLINMDIDPAELDVSEAVPLGLIVNEAVTNSLKYAHAGEINISLKATGIHKYELTMADNGIGLRENFDLDNVTSLGFKLIKGLSDQLEAKLSIINESGLKIKISGISVYHPGMRKQMTA